MIGLLTSAKVCWGSVFVLLVFTQNTFAEGTLPVPLGKTKAGADARLQQIENIRYHAKVTLDKTSTDYSVDSQVKFDLKSGCEKCESDSYLDLEGAQISLAEINGKRVDSATLPKLYDGQELHLMRKDLKRKGNLIRISFKHTYFDLVDGKEGSMGFMRFVDPIDHEIYLYTNFQPDGARLVFPTFDQPSLKGTLSLEVIAPAEWTVVANTRETSVKNLEGSRKSWNFPSTLPAPTYVFHISAGPLASWSYPKKVDGIPLRIFSRRSLAASVDADAWLEQSAKALHYFNQLFQYKYPFQKLDQVIEPLFKGTMENLAAIGISEQLVFGKTPGPASIALRRMAINHEISHMWFGNLVSMHWWDDESMIEGFCDSFALQEIREISSYPEAEILRYDSYVRAFPTELSPKAYSLTQTVPDTPSYENFFSGFMIRKSTAAVTQFREKVGPKAYLAIVRAYIKKYAFKNFAAKDFYVLAGEKLGKNFDDWREFWYGKPQAHRMQIQPVCAKEIAKDKNATCPEWLIPDAQTAEYSIPELDTETQKLMLEHVTDFKRPLDRLAAWTGLWVAVQQKSLEPQTFIDAVSKSIWDEPQPEVLYRALWLTSHKGSDSVQPGAIQLLDAKDQVSVKKRFKDQITERMQRPDLPADQRRVYEWNLKLF